MVQHRQDYDKYKRGTHKYMTSFKVIEGNNYRIELLETVDCNTKDELLAREGHYIKTINCVNKSIIVMEEEVKSEVLVWCTCSYNSTACCRNGRCKKEYEKRNQQEVKSDVLVWCTCSYNSTACCRNGRCKEEYEKRNNQI